MATSSAILQSFLRDSLKGQKKLADLSFEDLLAYNRTECGLIQINFDPRKNLQELENSLNGNDAIILHDDELFYAYKDATGRKVRKLPVPTEEKKIKYYNRLKEACSASYERATGSELKWIVRLTDRAYTQRRSDDFLPSLNFYLGMLDNTESVMIHYMNDVQKEELEFNLKITLLLLLAQKRHELEYQKPENLNKYNQYIKRCSKLLMRLDPEYRKRIRQFQAEPLDEHPVKYLGIEIGRLLANDMVDLTMGTTKTIKEYMGKLNEKRLYWVWGSSFLKTVIGGLAADYHYASQSSEFFKSLDPYTGTLSWTLYYARFFLELGLLLKHTIKGPWMSEEEAKTPWEERFLTQCDQRKFALLNDSIWGTANLACFFWLNGKGALGTAGDALTLVLLIFDIVMVTWDFVEQTTKHNKAMLQYDEDLARLAKQFQYFKNLERQRALSDEEQKEKRQIEIQIRNLEREKSKCERDWQLQKVTLIVNIAYAVGLMVSFAFLMTSMVTVGAVACLALTIIYNAAKGGIELYKTYKTYQEQKEDYDRKVNDLIHLFRQNPYLNRNEKKLLYLEIMQCQAETEYQKQMITYQSVNLARSILIEGLIPALVFVGIVLLPLAGVGAPLIIATIIAAAMFAMATQMLLDALFKPDEKKPLTFDEKAYEKFCKDTIKEHNLQAKPKLERDRLFSFGGEKERLLDSDDDIECLDYTLAID